MGRWGGRDSPYAAKDGGPGSGIKGHTTAESETPKSNVNSSFGEANPELKQWALQQISEAEEGRRWKDLPQDFERDAVRKVFERIKPHFEKKGIKSRISSSKASTFEDLRKALS